MGWRQQPCMSSSALCGDARDIEGLRDELFAGGARRERRARPARSRYLAGYSARQDTGRRWQACTELLYALTV